MQLLDLLFPKRSLDGSEGAFITDEERAKLIASPLKWDAYELRKRGIDALDELVAAGDYRTQPLLQKAIRTFKYKRVRELHEDLSRLMIDASVLLRDDGSTPILCPVPLHWTRKFWRGFNQAELLARKVGDAKDWSCELLLKRTRPTGHQARRKRREDRLRAIKSSFFRVPKEIPMPRYVILIDDLATTGATLNACAKALRKAGCRHIAALVIAQG